MLDDGESDFVWIRAHRPDRRWLAALRANPSVELRRDGASARFEARVFDDASSRRYVAAGFRDKYGAADLLREWTSGDDAVPIRLRPR